MDKLPTHIILSVTRLQQNDTMTIRLYRNFWLRYFHGNLGIYLTVWWFTLQGLQYTMISKAQWVVGSFSSQFLFSGSCMASLSPPLQHPDFWATHASWSFDVHWPMAFMNFHLKCSRIKHQKESQWNPWTSTEFKTGETFCAAMPSQSLHVRTAISKTCNLFAD